MPTLRKWRISRCVTRALRKRIRFTGFWLLDGTEDSHTGSHCTLEKRVYALVPLPPLPTSTRHSSFIFHMALQRFFFFLTYAETHDRYETLFPPLLIQYTLDVYARSINVMHPLPRSFFPRASVCRRRHRHRHRRPYSHRLCVTSSIVSCIVVHVFFFFLCMHHSCSCRVVSRRFLS